MRTVPGQFVPFYLDFSKCSNAEQAVIILESVRAISRQFRGINTDIKVGITYSANERQTGAIAEAYARGDFDTRTTGANQAEVMAEIEKLLRTDAYQDCRPVFRIIPITTIPNLKAHHRARVEEDIKKERQFLQDGNVILGWVNQNGLKPSNPELLLISGMFLRPDAVHSYAIGGGIATTSFPQALSDLVQNTFLYDTGFFPADSGILPGIEYLKIVHLKLLYKKHGGSDARAAVIFQDESNVDAVLEKLREGAAAHTGLFGTGFGRRVGASEKTLAEFYACPFEEHLVRAAGEPSAEQPRAAKPNM
jgi:hypothetical protein